MMTRRVAHYYPFLIAFLMILIPPTFGLWRLSVDNETIISPGNVFELGVFRGTSSFSGSEYYYLGIWFKRFPRIIVWVANGDTPLYNSTAFLKISGSHLYLLNVTGGLVWQANATIQDPFSGESVVAELLDSGNFVVRYANNSKPDGILWQSFDYPTDTLLPGMELGLFLQGAFQRKSLTSWAGPGDPANGRFTYGVDTRKDNFLESLIYDEYYVETARLEPSYAKIFRTYSNNQRVSCSLRTSINASYYAALRLSYDGVLRWWEWSPKAREMNSLWVLPDEDCDKYNECGPNARCFMSPLKACECLEGFHMSLSDGKEMGYVQNGCLRKSQLNCSVNHVFRKLPNAKLPRIDDDNMVEMSLGLEQCQEKCLKNCSCTAFANMEIPNGGSGCVTWVGDLNDIRTYQQQLLGQDFYLKVVPTHLVGETKNTRKNYIIIGLSAGAAGLLLLILITLCMCKIRRKKIEISTTAAAVALQATSQNMPGDCRLIQFDVIAEATNHFSESNIIGKGGYGVVYKGVFADGQGIAVKTLICLSRHGIQGFRNEVALISRVQHNNLVRLLGYCDNEDHKILVYEFLENSSLNKYIFDSARSPIILEWEDRLKIINGIARGLLYLHQDSRYRIIHLDLKPDNVLLGKDLVPKISDFGMAETLRNNETEANATTTAGTFGYMAPEYQSHGIFSAKSDVFSYGVMILEIVSGKKNRDYPKQNDGDQLLSVIWNNWSQGKGLEIVDSVIMNSPFGSKTELQIIRCIQIGLLCVQVDAEDRPTMSSVVLMLGTETVEIGQPKSPVETASSSSSSRQGQEFESSTINQITVSVFDAR